METLIGSRVFVWSKTDKAYFKGVVYEQTGDKCGVMLDSGKLIGVRPDALIQSLDWADDSSPLLRIRKKEDYKPIDIFKSSTSIIPTRALCKAMFYYIRKYGFTGHNLSTPRDGFFVKKLKNMLAEIQYIKITKEVLAIGINPIAFSYRVHFESMAHECVHGWQCDTQPADFMNDEGHGESFLTKAAEVSAKLGIRIEVTGDTIKSAMQTIDADDKKVPAYFIGIKRAGNIGAEVYRFSMLRIPQAQILQIYPFDAVVEQTSRNISTYLVLTRKPASGKKFWLKFRDLDPIMANRFIKGGRIVTDNGVLAEIKERAGLVNEVKDIADKLDTQTPDIPDEGKKQATPPVNMPPKKPVVDEELIEVAMLIDPDRFDTGGFKISLGERFRPEKYQGKPVNVYKVYRHEIEPLNLGPIARPEDAYALKSLKRSDMLALNAAIKRVNQTVHAHPKVDAFIKKHWKNWEIQL